MWKKKPKKPLREWWKEWEIGKVFERGSSERDWEYVWFVPKGRYFKWPWLEFRMVKWEINIEHIIQIPIEWCKNIFLTI